MGQHWHYYCTTTPPAIFFWAQAIVPALIGLVCLAVRWLRMRLRLPSMMPMYLASQRILGSTSWTCLLGQWETDSGTLLCETWPPCNSFWTRISFWIRWPLFNSIVSLCVCRKKVCCCLPGTSTTSTTLVNVTQTGGSTSLLSVARNPGGVPGRPRRDDNNNSII